jgi:Domain of unknown function (DUF4214)
MKTTFSPLTFTSILTLSGVITVLSIAPVHAYEDYCIVDRSNEIHCGRLATRDEIIRYSNGRRNDNYDRNNRDRNRYQIEDNIDRLYRDVLGRQADRDGLRTYSNRILFDGWSFERVRQDLANSQEAVTRINEIYQEILGRNADSEGLRHYINKLENGWSLNDLRRDIAKSDEARNRRNR